MQISSDVFKQTASNPNYNNFNINSTQNGPPNHQGMMNSQLQQQQQQNFHNLKVPFQNMPFNQNPGANLQLPNFNMNNNNGNM